ncbi:hypothetical protein ACN9JG_20635 (plasmid) [Cereibacter azotoformans]|nr:MULTISPECIES: hypothetical protein [Cereibacter]
MDLDNVYRLLRDPLLVLTCDLTVISTNPAFYRTFATDRDST